VSLDTLRLPSDHTYSDLDLTVSTACVPVAVSHLGSVNGPARHEELTALAVPFVVLGILLNEPSWGAG
jgi:hypothetical protein